MTYVARIKFKADVPFNRVMAILRSIPGRTALVTERGRTWRVYRYD